MRILIDNGDTFDGDAAMLQDCFGVTLDQLDLFCSANQMSYTIDYDDQESNQ